MMQKIMINNDLVGKGLKNERTVNFVYDWTNNRHFNILQKLLPTTLNNNNSFNYYYLRHEQYQWSIKKQLIGSKSRNRWSSIRFLRWQSQSY